MIKPNFLSFVRCPRIINLIAFLIIANIFTSCQEESYNNIDFPMKSFPDRKEDFSMWQLNAFDQHVQMGYIIRTDNGKIVVIDGGGIEQAHYLERILKMLGGNVDSWIITHPHYDHSGAFLKLIESNSINIKRLYHSELNNSWVNMVEPDFANKHRRYKEIVASSNIPVEDLTAGEELMLDMGVKLICLGAKNEDIKENAVNNSSLVFKIVSLKKSILFLGDLGVKGGEKLLKSIKKDEIKADYVQMAHHGQHGVDENVYKAISPNYALWPTPSWLWFNDNGNGGNSGNWKTLEVRKWMQALNIKENYVSGLDGTIQID